MVSLSARIQANGLRAGFFMFGIGSDLHNSTMNIAHVDQGGLTLSDRDYYLNQNAKMTEVRAKYLEHIQKMLTLAGETPEKAAADAKTILALETKLAEANMDRTLRRDPKNHDHKMSLDDLQKLAPGIDLSLIHI